MTADAAEAPADVAQSTAQEQVLVVPRGSLMGDPGWLGVTARTASATFEATVDARDGRFRPRAERWRPDRSWKQVIPYLVLRDGPLATS